ncbi:hypothetical protein [Sinorhizobium sp. NFACC03]|uniref:hypothetical protein n=1 Tax=Sinorhizobium sp. NFACC03 TaxID=1566295 RepID=UPI00115FF884|nr:hypothetical protein [Sinorhizobium sp. NFACC03]
MLPRALQAFRRLGMSVSDDTILRQLKRDNPASELGNVGTAAAIASAVYNATGKRVRDLPIRIDALIGSA